MPQINFNMPDELAALLAQTVPVAVTFTLQTQAGGTMQVTMQVASREGDGPQPPSYTVQ